MKKIIIFIILIIIVMLVLAYVILMNIANYKSAQKENIKFDIYLNKEISGMELSTLINKAVDYNTKNEVEKDNKGKYKDNGTNSINVDIKFNEQGKSIVYNIELIQEKGIETFMNFYRDIMFKCSNVQYHNNTNQIKHIIFEQII